MTSPRPAIVAAIIVDDGKVLMVRRRVAEESLSWQFPAGEMEPGESAFDTAIRETAEETSLKIVPISIIGERHHPATGRHMIYVSCTAEEGSRAILVDDEELDKVEWCSWSQVAVQVPGGLFEPVSDHLKATLTR